MTLRDHLRAAAVLAGLTLMTVLGTPGLDAVGRHALERPEERAAYRFPAWTLPLARGVVAFNREIRLPLVAWATPLQRPLRINQSWSLWVDGPASCARLEVQVDGKAVFRSADPELRWRASLFAAAPVRPIVDGTVSRPKGGGNWEGLVRLVVSRVREDFPGATSVTLRALQGPWDDCARDEHHRFEAKAPDWTPS